MNILLVSQEYPPETAHGGIATQALTKAKGLAALGHTVHVISHSIDGERHQISDSNIQVIRIPGLERRFPVMTEIARWLTYSLMVAEEIEHVLGKSDIDIIEFPEWAAEGYFYLLNRKERPLVPVVIHLQGPLVMFGHKIGWPDMQSSFYKTGTHMEAACIHMADAVYSSSECSSQWVRQYYDPRIKKIPVIHTGIDTNMFAPLPVDKYPNKTIIFSGHIVSNKGVTELVEASSKLSQQIPGLRLRILGRGEESFIQKLRKTAEQFYAPDLLEFPGFLPREVLPEELSRAHVFAAPSWYEGGPGFVYLEAMACGLPVIGCTGSGIQENVIHGQNGLLIQPKNTGALEQALRKILSDKDILFRMGRNARSYVEEHCDSINCLKKIEDYYLNVINDHRLRKSLYQNDQI